MIHKTLFTQSLLFFILLNTISGLTQDIPDPMQPPRMVNDFSGLLAEQERNILEQKLQSFYYQSSTQIYVIILDDLGGYDISDFAFQLGDKWGVGTTGKDNGIVVLLNPSPDRQHGKAFIATGYGLEGAVPDAVANRIVDYDMIPFFRQQQYYKGLDAACNTIIDLTRGEYTADEYIRSREGGSGLGFIVPFLILFVILFSIFGRYRTARQHSLGHGLPFWLALFLVSGSSGRHHGSFSNFSSGRGSFGGFGGFGGGGGGSFGGGGAGGSW